MPGYDFSVSMTLENTTDEELVVRIPRGSLIEPSSTARTQQSAVVKKDYIFRLNPRELRPVIIEAECWNRTLAPPHMTPGKVTPFSGKVQDTTEVWNVSDKSATGTPVVSPIAKSGMSDLLVQVGGNWACSVFEFMISKSTLKGDKDARERGQNYYTVLKKRKN